MLGAITGDIIGSVYEAHPIKYTEFPLFSPYSTFTDDTILTVEEMFVKVKKIICINFISHCEQTA